MRNPETGQPIAMFSLSEHYRSGQTGQQRKIKEMMQHVARETGQTTIQLFNDIMRLWANDLSRSSVPKTLSQGKKSIILDALKLFTPIEKFDDPRIRRRFNRGGDFSLPGTDLHFKPRVKADDIRSAVRSVHKRQRRGMVAYGPKERIVVRQRELRRYIRQAALSLGRLRAGWSAGVYHYGGSPPSWIARHGQKESAFRDEMNRETLDGALIIENLVPWAEERLGGEMTAALGKRASDLQNGYYVKRWQKQMEKMKA